uniref:Reverse transcriptase zinc-binding domain-containing protein n=1 Tax=Quercus lobata TaxID=97700 RepID=A0A7N2LNR1_QUELO
MMVHKLGFGESWINLVLECISTPTYLVLINGSPKGFFSSSRGLCQDDFVIFGKASSLTCDEILRVFGCYEKLSAFIGCSKRAAFEDLKSQVWSRLYGCKEKNLPVFGKEVLIKSVIQAIPSYVMSFFQLPVRLCKELTQMTAAYWWGQKHSEQKMHWLWDNLCVSIEVLVQESLSKKTWNQVPWRLSELNWWKLIRFSTGIPRHAFITWLAMRNKLSTWDKLL